MYLEISNGVDKPRLYRLERSTYFIGSQPESDICINDPDISRKHMTLVIDNGRFYVIDRGSTNGTFLDDEKLEPGKKVEFPIFADIRLGSKILVSLVPDEEVAEVTGEITIPLDLDLSTTDNSESTRQISIAELKKAKTTELVRQKKKVKAKAKKKKKKTNLNSYLALGILVMGGFSYMNMKEVESIQSSDEVTVASRLRTRKQEAQAIKADKKLKPSLLIDKTILADMYQEKKCADEEEKKLCELIGADQTGIYGARKLASNYLVYVDATNFIDEARATLLQSDESDINRLAALLYLHTTFAKPDIYSLVHSHNLIFAFYYNREMKFAMGMDSAYLKELNDQIKEAHFSIARRIGMSIFKYSNDYISLY